MNDYFYYLGFIYLIYSIHSLVGALFRTRNDRKQILVALDFSDIESTKETLRYANVIAKEKKTNWKLGIQLFFLIWSLIGFIAKTPEKYLFLTDVVVSCAITLVMMIQTAMAIFSKNTDPNKTIKFKNTIPNIQSCLEILIVSLILTNHFYPGILLWIS